MAHRAEELRVMLGDGTLTRVSSVDLGNGMTMPLEHAVKIALSDLDDLTQAASDGLAVDGRRWQQLGDDLNRLYRLATSGPYTKSARRRRI
jgi:hypothetical protein